MNDPETATPVLGVGNAALDLVSEVAAYPGEDEEVRALTQERRLGGNVANTLGVLRQFGHPCAWCGVHAGEAGGEEILAALAARGIDSRPAVCRPGRAPFSSILLSRATGSRTIVHFRDLPELEAADFARVPLAPYAWVHFEGRHPTETVKMLRDCARRRPDRPFSVEIEKPRPGIERLFLGPRVLFFSRTLARAGGYRDPASFLAARWADTSADILILGWGEQGAYGQARGGPLCSVPAQVPLAVIDSLGAGDVFHAAVLDGLLRELDLPSLLARANALAGYHCGRRGLEGLVASAHAAGWLKPA